VINQIRGMVAVDTEEGFSIVELLGDEVSVGDRLSWAGSTPLGGERVTNLSEGVEIDVFFQNHHVSRGQLRGALLF